MFAAAPFMWRRTMVAWALLMLACLASWVAPWWLIDGAGCILFACWPNRHARVIAVLFAAMLVGDLFNPAAFAVNYTLGWLQLLTLLLWGTRRLDWKPITIAGAST